MSRRMEQQDTHRNRCPIQPDDNDLRHEILQGRRAFAQGLGGDAKTGTHPEHAHRGPGKAGEPRHIVLLDQDAAAIAPRDLLERQKVERNVGQEVQQEHPAVDTDGHRARHQDVDGREIEKRLLPAIEIRQHRRQVVDALRQGETTGEQDSFLAPHVHRTHAPAHPLLEKGLDLRRGHAVSQRFAVIDRTISALVQTQAGVDVLGHRAGRETADPVECAAANHRATAAVEGGVPDVLAALDHAKEQGLFGPGDPAARIGAVLERIEVVEILRRLHERHLRIVEISQRLQQKIAPRRMIGIERRNEIGVAVGQGVVEIACLGVGVVAACEVTKAQRFRHFAHRRSIAVVENPCLVWIFHRARRQCSAPDHLDILVVRRDEDIHLEAIGRRRGLAVGETPGHEDIEQCGNEAEHLGAIQHARENGMGVVESAKAPVQVPEAHGNEQHDHCLAHRMQRSSGWSSHESVGFVKDTASDNQDSCHVIAQQFDPY